MARKIGKRKGRRSGRREKRRKRKEGRKKLKMEIQISLLSIEPNLSIIHDPVLFAIISTEKQNKKVCVTLSLVVTVTY